MVKRGGLGEVAVCVVNFGGWYGRGKKVEEGHFLGEVLNNFTVVWGPATVWNRRRCGSIASFDGGNYAGVSVGFSTVGLGVGLRIISASERSFSVASENSPVMGSTRGAVLLRR